MDVFNYFLSTKKNKISQIFKNNEVSIATETTKTKYKRLGDVLRKILQTQ